MNNLQLLEYHSIPCKVERGRLYALSVFTRDGTTGEEWMDVTEFSRDDVMYWLGY